MNRVVFLIPLLGLFIAPYMVLSASDDLNIQDLGGQCGLECRGNYNALSFEECV